MGCTTKCIGCTKQKCIRCTSWCMGCTRGKCMGCTTKCIGCTIRYGPDLQRLGARDTDKPVFFESGDGGEDAMPAESRASFEGGYAG
jgi:hypothetical protein